MDFSPGQVSSPQDQETQEADKFEDDLGPTEVYTDVWADVAHEFTEMDDDGTSTDTGSEISI